MGRFFTGSRGWGRAFADPRKEQWQRSSGVGAGREPSPVSFGRARSRPVWLENRGIEWLERKVET